MDAHVKGGTNAGWRNPFVGRAAPWQCDCRVLEHDAPLGPSRSVRKTNLGALTRCPDCGAERPC